MSNSLPATFDPIRLADEGAHLSGRLPARVLHRLAAVNLDEKAEVAVDLQFERTAQGQHMMHGQIETRIAVACQRCLEPLGLDVKAEPSLFFSRSEAGTTPPEDAEQIPVTKPLVLNDLVEDELLLALPMVQMHEEAECRRRGYSPAAGADEQTETGPFASLGRLKKRNDT